MDTPDSHSRQERHAEFRFYRELNDFLPAERRHSAFRVSFFGAPAIKDTLQAIGVPHTAIDLILVNGQSVGFDHRLAGGERISVFPEFERLDITPLQRLRPRPLRRTRFVLDSHLGKLARYLRMLGFDSVCDPRWDDSEIIDRSLAEKRIILTRDRGILKQTRVTHGYWLRSHEPLVQLREVLEALHLHNQIRPFSRCMTCNGEIEAIDRDRARPLIAESIWQRFAEFWQCRQCRRVYWKGTHYQRMCGLVEQLRSAPGAGG